MYRAVIIGAGRIASGYDHPQSPHVLTHAHALLEHPSFSLKGITDIDSVRGEKEARKWEIPFFNNTEVMLSEVKPDLVIIATPDNTHTDLLQRVATEKPNVIICEKPVVSTRKEGELLRRYFAKHPIPVIINFSRRFDPVVCRERDALVRGEYGRVISAGVIYSNGVLNNGSHAMDLARFFFGEIITAKAFCAVPDYGQKNPSIAGFATFERCPQFSFRAGDERVYSVFEFEVFTERKYLKFVNFGVELKTQDVIPDPVFAGFRGLAEQITHKTGFPRALTSLLDHAVAVLEGKETPRSSLDEGIKTQEACFKLLDSLEQQ